MQGGLIRSGMMRENASERGPDREQVGWREWVRDGTRMEGDWKGEDPIIVYH